MEIKCTLNCWLLNFSGWIPCYYCNFSMLWKEPSFPTFSNWQNMNQDLKESGHTPSFSCRELKWGGSKDERVNPPESERERRREREEKRKSVRTKVFAFLPATTDQYLAFRVLSPSFSLPSDRKQLVCAKGAQMRRLNKALDAHSKALLLILQVSAEPLWPVTCPELCCFARLWVDLAQGIMHEFGHRHMCLSSVLSTKMLVSPLIDWGLWESVVLYNVW